MKKLLIHTVLVVIISVNLASASYISGDIYLYENGEARFNIQTDTPIEITGLTFSNEKITGITPELISLKQGVWTFELNLENYDSILLDIRLPSNLDYITSLSQNLDNLIDTNSKTITLIDSGELDFTVSYKLKNVQDLTWLVWPSLIAVIIIAYLIYKKSRKKRDHLEHIMPLINEQEQKILDSLMKHSARQKDLRKKLNIPKASFSRYLSNLEKKKLIQRQGEGKNKIVKLK